MEILDINQKLVDISTVMIELIPASASASASAHTEQQQKMANLQIIIIYLYILRGQHWALSGIFASFQRRQSARSSGAGLSYHSKRLDNEDADKCNATVVLDIGDQVDQLLSFGTVVELFCGIRGPEK